MTVFVFDSARDPNVKLLVPSMMIPEAAKKHFKDRWRYSGVLPDFQPDDARLAIDAATALQDISTKGFHIARLPVPEEAEKH